MFINIWTLSYNFSKNVVNVLSITKCGQVFTVYYADCMFTIYTRSLCFGEQDTARQMTSCLNW